MVWRLFGEVAVATLAEAGPDVDMVDIFRRQDALSGVVVGCACQVLPDWRENRTRANGRQTPKGRPACSFRQYSSGPQSFREWQ